MTANNESKESQVEGRGLTQRTVPVWKKGLRTLKNCARTRGVPTDLLTQHLSDTSQKDCCLNVLYLLGSLHTNSGVSYCSH
jgi:hypothetical protein